MPSRRLRSRISSSLGRANCDLAELTIFKSNPKAPPVVINYLLDLTASPGRCVDEVRAYERTVVKTASKAFKHNWRLVCTSNETQFSTPG
jgi:hypothetical protein